MNVITKTWIDDTEEKRCPHCGELAEDTTFEDGEVLTLDPDPANVDVTLFWGRCVVCTNVLYMMDLAMIPEQGLNFFNDYRWAAEGPSLYRVNIPGYSGTMYLARYRNVHDVTLIGKEEDEIYEVPVSWLDLYRSPLWAADDLAAALNRAKVMAESIVDTPIER
jgi:hypothetical protein